MLLSGGAPLALDVPDTGDSPEPQPPRKEEGPESEAEVRPADTAMALSGYEMEREERIARNQRVLADLGVHEVWIASIWVCARTCMCSALSIYLYI